MQKAVLFVMISIKRSFSKGFNAERIVKIFGLGLELQLSYKIMLVHLKLVN